MIFKKYPITVTKDSDGNHYVICADLNFGCTVHEMTLPEACGSAICAIHTLCNSLTEQGIALPEATPLEVAKQTAPKNALLIATIIVARREEGDPNY